jgi:hypothetical protein
MAVFRFERKGCLIAARSPVRMMTSAKGCTTFSFNNFLLERNKNLFLHDFYMIMQKFKYFCLITLLVLQLLLDVYRIPRLIFSLL